MRISDWSSDVCSSDLVAALNEAERGQVFHLHDLTRGPFRPWTGGVDEVAGLHRPLVRKGDPPAAARALRMGRRHARASGRAPPPGAAQPGDHHSPAVPPPGPLPPPLQEARAHPPTP